MSLIRTLVAGLALLLASSGQVIAEVINIDAQVSGNAFSLPTSPELVPVTAGLYKVTLINPTIDPLATFTAWRFHGGPSEAWETAFNLYFADDSKVTGGFSTAFFSATEAFDATVTEGLQTLQFVVPTDQTLRFTATDNFLNSGLTDNTGGISLALSQVPLPPALA